MNQSLAMFMKLKLFQGSQPETSGAQSADQGTKKGRKQRKWGKTKRGMTNGISASPSHESQSLMKLNSIGEEEKSATLSEDFLRYEGCEHENRDDANPINGRVYESSDDRDSGNESSRRQGKLRTLKSKMNIPELSFRSSSSPRTANETDATRHSFSPGRDNRSENVPSFPSSFKTSASDCERDSSGYNKNRKSKKNSSEKPRPVLSPVSKIASNSSTSSSKHLNSSTKNEIQLTPSNASSVRFSKSSIVGNGSTVTSPVKQSIKGNATMSFHHSRSGSVEVKTAKIRSLPIGRRRSRTVDVSDYVRTNKEGFQMLSPSNEMLSSVGTNTRRSRSNSQASRSPLLNSQDSSHILFSNMGTVHGTVSPTPPRLSSGSIPFPNLNSQQGIPQPPISRRSSSIVNAFNSFVNLRSSSASSMKGPSMKAMTPRLDISLDDLPPPPEPELNESRKEFLAKLGSYGKFIGIILCERDDPFKEECLIYFLSNFLDFDYDPLDISMRKLLMFLELPKETQQIDRLLSAFGKVYYESQEATEEYCPWTNSHQVYFVAFSLLMLHTDYFNPKNKHKMSKAEFVDLVHEDHQSDGCKVPKEILSYYYDNIIARESPSFDFMSNQQGLTAIDSSEPDSFEPLSTCMYSPIEIVRSSGPTAYYDHIPITYTSRGRVSSNSFSSYFQYVPASTSSSSTSLLQDDIDIYAHILEDSLSQIDMTSDVDKVWDDDCLSKSLVRARNKYNKYFSILKEVKGGYLKIHKSHLAKIAISSFETLNECDDEFRYVKIVQMGEIHELTINKKFSIIGSVNKISWKKEYAILTSCGLLLFDNKDWINPRLVRDELTNSSNYIIDYSLGACMTPESPVCCNGLFAIRKEDELAKTGVHKFEACDAESNEADSTGSPALQASLSNWIMHIHGSQKEYVWKCGSKYERDNWIDSINLMAAYDGCHYNPGSVGNSIITLRKLNIKERLNKLENTKKEKSIKLQELQTLLPLYRQSMPLSYKTRNELTGHIKQLAVRLDWLVYEIKRNEVYLAIIRQVDANFEQYLKHSSEEDDLESQNHVNSINESFIFNEDLLPECIGEDDSVSYQSFESKCGDFLLKDK